MKTDLFTASKMCLLCFIFLNVTCKSQKSKIDNSIFLNIKEASEAIVTDDSEHFFSKIQPIDVAIQMKNNDLLHSNDFVEKYKKFLKSEVSEFSENEKKMMLKVIKDAFDLVAATNKKGVNEFKIAKIKTNHYGPNVYYTRGNTIFIPENIFNNFNDENVTTIILHEFWHILAEQYPQLKEKMYAIIGFKKNTTQLEYPEVLKSILLTNPDGAHDDYTLNTKNGRRIIPLITSGRKKFDPQIQDFFSYLKFDLFEVDVDGKVKANQNGETVLNIEDQQNYFNYIGDNTQYIIHPDEIIADNFMLAVKANKSGDYNKFSASGKSIITKLIEVLKN